MRTVKEVSKLTGVSIRTLHYYDEIGLLHPTSITDAGYRLYDDTALERLQHIMLFRELEFSLKDIKDILDSHNFDRNRALEQQIELLLLKREHIDNLITFARAIRGTGVNNMDFSAFDATKLEDYTAQAKAIWGKTEAYKEFEEKMKDTTDEKKQQMEDEMMSLFVEFGQMRKCEPKDKVVQEQVAKLQKYITDNYYTCTREILAGLGKMYNGGGSMTENIDHAGGKGTAEFVAEAIKIYCNS